jgi:16S rRNA (guanine527-N7)-methyltransferase
VDLLTTFHDALSNHQRQLLSRYLDLLLDANLRMNLTRITDRDAAQVQHIGDALSVLAHLPDAPHALADVGTGGGVPGIPLAIARPDTQITLIEATGKKVRFLEEAVRALELTNVRTVHARAEDAARGALRESFDIAVARAVGEMVWVAEWCLPLVRKGGNVLAMKGPKVHDELPRAARAIRMLSGGEPVVHPVQLPGTSGHVIVRIPKIGRTPAQYPRAATMAKGKPLA